MASSNENVSMALFCDFENVALGVRDANYDKFDIKPVLERLLLKGSIVVKKAYCDWDRYKGFKAGMHEANFELIEIPHVRQSGKNSADIRMVVDALDLCYTKSHVDTFVIISGDSDFSPLVSKLRENAKKVIGVGVKQSTSDLLVANCDEFIFYDDLVRESRRARRDPREAQPVKRSPEEEKRRREEKDRRRSEAVDIAVGTFDALVSERGDSGKIWASVLKEAIKRRKPDFSESYYGFRTFGNLIEEAKARGLLEFGRDEKSGAYVYRGSGVPSPLGADALSADEPLVAEPAPMLDAIPVQDSGAAQQDARRGRGNRGGRKQGGGRHGGAAQTQAGHGAEADSAAAESPYRASSQAPSAPEPVQSHEQAVAAPVSAAADGAPGKRGSGQKPPARKVKEAAKRAQNSTPAKDAVSAPAVAPAAAVAAEPAPSAQAASEAAPAKPARKPAARRPAKPKAAAQAKAEAKPEAAAEGSAKPAAKPRAGSKPRAKAKPASEA